MPSPTRAISPIEDAIPASQYAGREQLDVTPGTTGHRETEAFLPSEHSVSTSPKERTPHKSQARFATLMTTWWFEIISLILAMAALIAIAVTMAEYHKKEQPAWKFSINLNTMIAILSALLRVCVVFVVEEVISQLKWMWFRRPQPLRHLAQFDDAARGSWGSLLLFFRIRRLDSALMGCIVIVLSFGIGPFTQQAVRSVSCDLPLETSEASIQIARWMSHHNTPRLGSAHWDLDLETKAAILDGLANPNTTRSAISPVCSTGNCSFPSYDGVTHSSVGLCKKCVNITPWLTEAHNKSSNVVDQNGNPDQNSYDFNLILSDGYGVGGGRLTFNYTPGDFAVPTTPLRISNGVGWESLLGHPVFDESFKAALQASIVNVSIIALTQDGCTWIQGTGPGQSSERHVNCPHLVSNFTPYWDFINVVAAGCTFYPCVKNFHGTVDDTIFTETIVSETPLLTIPHTETNYWPNREHFNSPCVVDNLTYTLANVSSIPEGNHNFTYTFVEGKNVSVPEQCVYAVSGVYTQTLSEFMDETVLGNCTFPAITNLDNTPTSSDWDTATCQGWWLKSLINKGYATFQRIDANMEAIATAVTSEIRKQGNDPNGEPAFVKGTVFRATVCTQFDWIWLAFPLTLIALTTLLLFAMCGKTLFEKNSVPAWKSSVLPLLFTGNGMAKTGALENMKEIEGETDKAVVTLLHTGRGWEFISERFSDAFPSGEAKPSTKFSSTSSVGA
ncbi:Nn.00g043420.m01.CDS01 [Neocucurbitaria sp. VM-36]